MMIGYIATVCVAHIDYTQNYVIMLGLISAAVKPIMVSILTFSSINKLLWDASKMNKFLFFRKIEQE